MLKEKLNKFIEAVSNLKVVVIGETITDEFVEVSYEGQSMKSFCPAFRVEGPIVRQSGGAGAISGHLKGFVKSVELISNSEDEIIKTRYMDSGDGSKHVEINRFNYKPARSISILSSDYDVVIMADYGHGYCDAIDIDDGFHLVCQTNSNNFGFNRISKWKNKKKKSKIYN